MHVWITCWAARKGSVQASCVNEKNVLFCLEGMLFIHFFVFSVVLCIYRCVIHSHFLHSYLLLCNWLFSRHQTFLAKDTNVCSVVMDMLGIRLQSLAPCCWCGRVSLRWCSWFFFSCSGQNQSQVLFSCVLPIPVGWLPWRWFLAWLV